MTIPFAPATLTDAESAMAAAYYPLALKAAHYNRRTLTMDEAHDAAVDELIRAIQTYDPDKCKLASWVVNRVCYGLRERRKYYTRYNRSAQVLSLDVPVSGADAPLYETLECPRSRPDETAIANRFHDDLLECRNRLPVRWRQALELYQDEGLTLAEIGRVMGYAETRANQVRHAAMARLRTLMTEKGWEI